ncbi:MAG: hypothetical protein B6240_00700 [Desulfobacteraceae bacterium 4572_87]|nr:MAG: hypothetical protein B6240_00700 [Desulfobacteraceae bacterium 4572_87]
MKKTAIEIQESLEHRILHGLSCEWDTALWVLPSLYDDQMRKPLFAIHDMNSRWGYWSGKNREIVMSRSLVMEHSWSAVRQVLKHEMAHQFAEEVLGARNEPPHGPCFKEACYHLRADPAASGNFRLLDERDATDSKNHEDKLMVRIKKLMSLAQSQNRHEAEAAMSKAHELVGKYNLDLIRLEADRNFISVFLGKPKLRRFREEHLLAYMLGEFYYVYVLWVSTYVMDKGKMGRVMEISGTEKNVEIASYVYDFVNRFIESQWRAYNRNKGLNRYRRTDFAIGVLEGFERKLNKQSEQHASATGSDVMKVEDPLLKKYAAYRYPHTHKNRGKPLNQDTKVREDGEAVGAKLVISKGIHHKGGNGGLLLE